MTLVNPGNYIHFHSGTLHVVHAGVVIRTPPPKWWTKSGHEHKGLYFCLIFTFIALQIETEPTSLKGVYNSFDKNYGTAAILPISHYMTLFLLKVEAPKLRIIFGTIAKKASILHKASFANHYR